MFNCILCQLRRHTDPNLMEVCPICQQAPAPKVAKHKPFDAMADENNVVKAITCTLTPKYHTVDPDKIVATYREIVMEEIRPRRNAAFFEGAFELTDQGVLHMHCYVAIRKYGYARLLTRFRRLGFCKVKNVDDIQGWITYMYKDQDGMPSPIIICS